MSNPAKLLHEQLNNWDGSPSKTASAARDLNNGEGWATIRVAMQLLLDTEELMDRVEQDGPDLSTQRKYLKTWTAMVIAHPDGWNSAGNHSISRTALDALSMTATVLDTYVPKFEAGGDEKLRQFLEVIDQKLGRDDSCLAQHAKRVVAHIRKLLIDWEMFGEFRIVDALGDLKRILDALAELKPEDPFWRNAAKATWAWFKKDLATALAAGIAVNALTSGAAEVSEIVSSEMAALTASDTQSGDGSELE